jgi:hypothetical protein
MHGRAPSSTLILVSWPSSTSQIVKTTSPKFREGYSQRNEMNKWVVEKQKKTPAKLCYANRQCNEPVGYRPQEVL